MKLYRGFATVGAMTVISRVLGFVRDVGIAAVLGTSYAADAFFVAFRVPNMFRRLFAEGAFDAAFIPLFAKRFHADGAEAARAFAGQALAGLTLLLVVLVVLAEIAMPWLMLLLAPGFRSDPAKFDLAVLLARIALPYLVCMALVALYTGMLNALGRFALAAFAPSLLNVVLIAALLAMIAAGVEVKGTAAITLAWAVAVSGVLQVLLVIFAAARSGMGIAFQRPRLTPEMKRLMQLAAPGLLAGGMAQITLVIGTIIATLQDRVVSWLYYADRIFQLPLGVIGVAIGVVLLPDLSHKLRAGDHQAVALSENRALQVALLLTVPAATALYIAALPIIRVLFQRGAFAATDTEATAAMLSALALGLPAYVLIKVLHPSFFAREDTKTPMILAGIAMAANVVLSFALFFWIGPVGIALATTLAGWLNVTLLAIMLKRRGEFTLNATFRRALFGIVAASAVMGAGVWVLATWLEPYLAPGAGLLVQGAALALLVGAGLVIYAASVELSGAVRLRSLPQILLGR
ncbi:MAG TPA: murein biosynthesis integral membrane protein MurJ [Methyloceanibacter sp.]|nr:murein biosynthesis integral membrane protein MurJ [Methyloceanibacter sp.]